MTASSQQPLDEAARQRALDRYHVIDSLPEAAYDDIVQLASTLCGTPTALITLLDRDRQWFKARVGFDGTETARSVAVCDYAVRRPDQLMEIQDLMRDDRFADNPFVNGESGDARFYAGMPLVTPEGAAIGTVCVLDAEPRELNDEQRTSLQSLARLTMSLLEARARERELKHEAFVAAVTPPAAAAAATPAEANAPGYLLVLMELQDLASAAARLGERTTEKLLERLDEVLERVLPADGEDAINRSSGSAEYVAVLHGPQAQQTLDRLRAAVASETGAHGLQFLFGTATGKTSEPTGAVFMRADADLLDQRTAAAH